MTGELVKDTRIIRGSKRGTIISGCQEKILGKRDMKKKKRSDNKEKVEWLQKKVWAFLWKIYLKVELSPEWKVILFYLIYESLFFPNIKKGCRSKMN